MTLQENDRELLIKHRIDKSHGIMLEAEQQYRNGLFNTAVNRIYYSMYHIVSALALKNNFITSKHLQLIGWFNRELVKTGKINTETGKFLMIAFEMRSKGDYDDFVNYSDAEVRTLIENVKNFISEVEKQFE